MTQFTMTADQNPGASGTAANFYKQVELALTS
jgi:hypothetical protein